jgi:hypothetical protein
MEPQFAGGESTLRWRTRSRRRCARSSAAPTFYGGYSGYFTDPDGHPWEVVCAPGIDVQADGRVTLPD